MSVKRTCLSCDNEVEEGYSFCDTCFDKIVRVAKEESKATFRELMEKWILTDDKPNQEKQSKEDIMGSKIPKDLLRKPFVVSAILVRLELAKQIVSDIKTEIGEDVEFTELNTNQALHELDWLCKIAKRGLDLSLIDDSSNIQEE